MLCGERPHHQLSIIELEFVEKTEFFVFGVILGMRASDVHVGLLARCLVSCDFILGKRALSLRDHRIQVLQCDLLLAVPRVIHAVAGH